MKAACSGFIFILFLSFRMHLDIAVSLLHYYIMLSIFGAYFVMSYIILKSFELNLSGYRELGPTCFFRTLPTTHTCLFKFQPPPVCLPAPSLYRNFFTFNTRHHLPCVRHWFLDLACVFGP